MAEKKRKKKTVGEGDDSFVCYEKRLSVATPLPELKNPCGSWADSVLINERTSILSDGTVWHSYLEQYPRAKRWHRKVWHVQLPDYAPIPN